MQAYRPDRVVRVLTFLVSMVYYGAWLVGALALSAVSAVELLAKRDTLMDFTIGVPVTVALPDVRLTSGWAAGTDALTLDDDRVHSELEVPIAVAPASFRAMMYVGLVVLYGLMLVFLYHLRQLFLRVRAGAPFDARNALRLRWLGLLLLASHVGAEAVGSWGASIVLGTVTNETLPLGASFEIDEKIVFIALVLIALAEIFRRGAALEEEQSLVV